MNADVIDLTRRVQLADNLIAPEDEERRTDVVRAELRRARRRISQLERNLTIAMRDSLHNFRRAQEAERELKERQLQNQPG